jgi:hypothetical protein
MNDKIELHKMDARIKAMKASAEELKSMAEDFPALYRNTSRALASIKMLELNLSDLMDEGLLP